MSSSETLLSFFSDDHRACDEAWAAVEAAADGGDVPAAWTRFSDMMARHFHWEEQVAFPAFEQATGMTMGPTAVMRSEHEAMRGLLGQMADALAQGDVDELLDQGDTLMMLIQQHNMKEEGMLYPMMQQHLGGDWPGLKARLKA